VSKPRELGDRLPKDAGALIFRKDGLEVALPRAMKPEDTLPEHMVICCAIGYRLMRDAEWRAKMPREALEWLDTRVEGAEDKA